MKKWAVLFAIFIMIIVVLADTRHLGFIAAIYDFPYGDKVGHFVLFGLLSLLVNMAVFEHWRKQTKLCLALLTSLVLAVLIGLEEWSQRLFASRQSSVWDLLASYLGVAAFAWVAFMVEKQRRAPKNE